MAHKLVENNRIGMEGVRNLYPLVVRLVAALGLRFCLPAASMSPGDAPTFAPIVVPAAGISHKTRVVPVLPVFLLIQIDAPYGI
jgi:hypothetical protein